MNLALWLDRTARRLPAAPALLAGPDICADYSGFARSARSLAGALTGHHGVRPGDRVGLFCENRPDWLVALYGIWWAGAAAVPVNAKLHGSEAAWILDDAGARLTLVSHRTAATLGDAAGPVLSLDGEDWRRALDGDGLDHPLPRTDEDLAWLFYTSGTTGRPKGVMLSHGNLAAMSLCYPLDVDPVSAADATLYAAPMSHGAGLYALIHVRAGARHVVAPSGGFDADEILDLAPRIGRVAMFAAPTMVNRLVRAAERRGGDGEGLRTIVYGGGPMYVADIERAVEVMGPRFVQIYGQGESPMTITALARELVADRAHPRWRERLASVGVAHSAVEVAVAGPDGRHLPPETDGEVIVRGPTVMAGYWQNPQATAEALRDAWLHTGDIGRLDADGFLTLTDRAKDVVISGGSNIYPREVEEAALTHPAVAEISCVGRPDPEWGEALVAFWVPAEGADPDPAALDAHLAQRLARYKRPKEWIRVSELPKNNYGKVLKTALRARLKRG